MKKLIFTFSIFLGLLFLNFVVPKNVSACSALSVTPSTGPQGTGFVGNATGCNAGINDYAIWLIYPDQSETPQGTLTNITPEGIAALPIGSPSTLGTYRLELRLGPPPNNVLASATFTVTENENEEVPTERPYMCGETVPFSTQSCSVSNPYNCCPAICPTSSRGDGSYFCKIDTPYVCSATRFSSGDDSIGIDTPIGCIPIANVNYIASFFLQWGASILGGLGFLIIIGVVIK